MRPWDIKALVIGLRELRGSRVASDDLFNALQAAQCSVSPERLAARSDEDRIRAAKDGSWVPMSTTGTGGVLGQGVLLDFSEEAHRRRAEAVVDRHMRHCDPLAARRHAERESISERESRQRVIDRRWLWSRVASVAAVFVCAVSIWFWCKALM